MCRRMDSSTACRPVSGDTCAFAVHLWRAPGKGRSAAPDVDGATRSGGRPRVSPPAAVIDLLAGEDHAGFGIACVLDIERIPYRRIPRAEDFDARLLVVTGDHVTPAVLRLAARSPSLIIGSPALPPRELFGVGGGRTMRSAVQVS